MPTPDADWLYVHPAYDDGSTGPLRAASTASTLQRLDAVLWYERGLLEALVQAHAGARRTDDPEIARLTDERRATSLLRLVESAQLAEDLGLPPGSTDFAGCLDGGWRGVLTGHEVVLSRLTRQLYASDEARPFSRGDSGHVLGACNC